MGIRVGAGFVGDVEDFDDGSWYEEFGDVEYSKTDVDDERYEEYLPP